MKDPTVLGALFALLSLSHASAPRVRRQTSASASTSASTSDTASATTSSAAASSSVIVAGDTFHHRVSGQSIVVGNYLYIDGGELTTWSQSGDGFQYDTPQADGNIVSLADNYTYSVDLTRPWTTDSVVLNQIDKGRAPALRNGALWQGPTGETFYQYDGSLTATIYINDQPEPPPNQLWEFTPSGSSGAWSEVEVDPNSNFSSLIRSSIGMYTSTPGLGFALGGTSSVWTQAGTDDDYEQFIDTMVVYNSTSQEWYNVTAVQDGGSQTWGAAHFVPIYGPEGLLFIFGGYQGADAASFEWALMYEPQSQQWQYQKVTGDIPAKVKYPCIAGVEGDDGTYEIFLYGGLAIRGQTSTIEQSGSVHVLSLPSFNWVKEDTSPEFGRIWPTCTVIGNRHMAVVGGMTEYRDSPHFDPDDDSYGEGQAVDPWRHGIGLYDMSAMRWVDSYDPNADAYVTPDAVKADDNFKRGAPVEWANDEMKGWFTTDRRYIGSESSTSGASTSSSSSDSSTNVGAIAGGVVGGVVVLALIGVLIWFFMRRKRRQQPKSAQQPHEADSQGYYQQHGYHADPKSSPYQDQYQDHELQDTQRTELYGSHDQAPKQKLWQRQRQGPPAEMYGSQARPKHDGPKHELPG